MEYVSYNTMNLNVVGAFCKSKNLLISPVDAIGETLMAIL